MSPTGLIYQSYFHLGANGLAFSSSLHSPIFLFLSESPPLCVLVWTIRLRFFRRRLDAPVRKQPDVGHWPTFLGSEARARERALAGREAALGYLCSAAPAGTVRLLPRGVQVVLPLSPRGRCRCQVLSRTRACGRAFRSWRSLTPRGEIPVPLPTSRASALVEFARIGRSADPDKASPAPSP